MAFVLPLVIGTPIAIYTWNVLATNISKNIKENSTLDYKTCIATTLASSVPLYMLLGRGYFSKFVQSGQNKTWDQVRRESAEMIGGGLIRMAGIWYGTAITSGIVNGQLYKPPTLDSK